LALFSKLGLERRDASRAAVAAAAAAAAAAALLLLVLLLLLLLLGQSTIATTMECPTSMPST